MIRYWPYKIPYNVLFTFENNTKVKSICFGGYEGIKAGKENDVYDKTYRLLGPYVISNWSEEE